MGIFGDSGSSSGRWKGPLRQFLDSWQPIIPRPKLFGQTSGDDDVWSFQELPGGVTRDQAIQVIMSTPWARDAGQGIANKICESMNRPLDDPVCAQIAEAWARAIATGMVNKIPVSAIPTVPATSTRSTRRRR